MADTLSIIVVTRNEAHNLPRCLAALRDFSQVFLVDSQSTDGTPEIAAKYGATVVPFSWDGRYPKKRQWCLDNLPLAHDRVFFVDADEEVTPELAQEIRNLPWDHAGYFVPGQYAVDGVPLRFGLRNSKLALFNRRKIAFPEVGDLNIPGMGEIEGHYQPVLKPGHEGEKIGRLKNALLHHAFDDPARWEERHEGYAAWESGMRKQDAYPRDPSGPRQILKVIFRKLPGRPLWAFLHCYIVKLGIFDGARGLQLARSRWRYYALQR